MFTAMYLVPVILGVCHFLTKLSKVKHNSIIFSNATACPYRLRGPPFDYGWSVTDFWDWGAHRAQLRCPDDVNDDVCERGVPGGALSLSSTG
jgi:hypothetical protein